MHRQLGLFNGLGMLADKVQAAHVFHLNTIRMRLQTFGVVNPGHDVLV